MDIGTGWRWPGSERSIPGRPGGKNLLTLEGVKNPLSSAGMGEGIQNRFQTTFWSVPAGHHGGKVTVFQRKSLFT